MRKSMCIVTILALSLVLSGAVMAQRGGRRGGARMQDLELDEGQIEQLEGLRMEHRLEMVDLRAEQRKLRLKMRMMLLDGELDRDGLEQMAGKIAGVREKIEKRRLGHLLAVRKVLNDDQWKEFLRRRHGGRGFCGMGRPARRMHGVHGMKGEGGHMMPGPGRRGGKRGHGGYGRRLDSGRTGI